jgi:hypothetical protein
MIFLMNLNRREKPYLTQNPQAPLKQPAPVWAPQANSRGGCGVPPERFRISINKTVF